MGDSGDGSFVPAQQTHYSSALLGTTLTHFLCDKFALAAYRNALKGLSIEDYGKYMRDLRLIHSERQLCMAVTIGFYWLNSFGARDRLSAHVEKTWLGASKKLGLALKLL